VLLRRRPQGLRNATLEADRLVGRLLAQARLAEATAAAAAVAAAQPQSGTCQAGEGGAEGEALKRGGELKGWWWCLEGLRGEACLLRAGGGLEVKIKVWEIGCCLPC
jgi:hypothetical protein